MTKIEGSGTRSIKQRNGSADPDPDPHQNVMGPQHWYVGTTTCIPLENKLQLLGQVSHNSAAALFTAVGSISRPCSRCCSLLLPPLNGGVQGRLQR
jgi:hypothetical protein